MGLNNTSGTTPRDPAKIVRTTIHSVSVEVLRMKLHLVLPQVNGQVFVGTHPGVSFTR